MPLKLSKPLVVFDLETTGVDVATARIIEIAMVRVEPDGFESTLSSRVNPGMPIPPSSTAIHGITDADVVEAPRFIDLIPEVDQFIQGADLGGYNSSRFDVPLLAEEFHRNGAHLDVSGRQLIDAMAIFSRMEPRTLVAAYKKFCGKELKDAHSALADTMATKEVLFAQPDYYEELPCEVEALSVFCRDRDYADLAGRLGFDNDGDVVFKFGKYKGAKVKEVFARDGGYYNWIMNSDFPIGTKDVLTQIFRAMRAR
ncbi:MAG: DNA polymerase III subunit epsilon [Bacteroidia bacterium]|nr:MAG: DNA polymerase III subunit epsilon [Bacteroidia bacterium]